MSCFCRRALKICRWKIVSLVLIARYVCCMDPAFEKYPKTAFGRLWCRALDCRAEDRGLHTQGLKKTEENVLSLP